MINPWTIFGIILIAVGSYCLHFGSRQSLINISNEASDRTVNATKLNTDKSIEIATDKITNPIQDVDMFLINNYKPIFDKYFRAHINYKMFEQAIEDISSGVMPIKDASEKTTELAIIAIERKLSENNNEINLLREQLNSSFRSLKLLTIRINDKSIVDFIDNHEVLRKQGQDFMNGANGKEKSVKEAVEFLKLAEVQLVAAIASTGFIKGMEKTDTENKEKEKKAKG